MFGKNNSDYAPDIEKDRKRKNRLFTATFAIAALIILNFVLYFATKI